MRLGKIECLCRGVRARGRVVQGGRRSALQRSEFSRFYSTDANGREEVEKEVKAEHDSANAEEEIGPMTRRLRQLAEEAPPVRHDSTFGKEVPDEDFMSEEEIRDLQERLSARVYKEKNAQYIAAANLPASASKHTRDIAYSKPWTGTEAQEDAVLRMLVDVNKPLRIPGGGRGGAYGARSGGGGGYAGGGGGANGGTVIPMPTMAKAVPNSVRLSEAREKSLEYSLQKVSTDGSGSGKTPTAKKKASTNQLEEDSEFRKIYAERFRPPRAMPGTLHGLRAIADERIEDARARGQFKNIPRGGKLDMDARISSPFLDTTEFFLNRIIQRQDIQPPWIDKQATVRQDIRRFRIELREQWKRHAMRLISTERPNSLEQQMELAQKYADAELLAARKQGLLKSKPKDTTEAVDGFITAERLAAVELASEILVEDKVEVDEFSIHETDHPRLSKREWEEIEKSYHELSIKTLNDSIRSYNLMAPAPARRAYLSIDRERQMCYAEVAPLLADALRDREEAIRSGRNSLKRDRTAPGSVVTGLFGDQVVVMEKRGGEYGFKEMFKDWFGRKKRSSV
ncbi:hypothetical protein BZA70DRAFT_132520 [Myxozyma melibiosi]|uniref:DnaJ homologue subfamily C member 28 conserved domain-containing protein n=1 Tax=Myxozyma melibiosi TaxID=54550 RepID=A0ABR1FBB1_9ASCO